MVELHDYQKPHARKLLAALRQYGVAKDGSDCGTGKTPVGAWVAAQTKRPVLVVCPKIMIGPWTNWLKQAGVSRFQVLNPESLRGGNRPLVSKHRLPGGSNRYYFRWELDPETLFLWDEDHTLAGIDTLNSKLSRAATYQRFKQLYIGATTFTGPEKMNALGFAFGLHEVADFMDWCMRNGCHRDRFRRLRFNGSAKVLDELHRHFYGGLLPRGSRMRVADLGELFPANNVVCDCYTVDNAEQIQQCYEDLLEELERLDWKESEDYDSELVLRLRARQRAELYKVPLLYDLTRQHLDAGMSVVVFLSFRDSLEALERKLKGAGIESVSITGVSTPSEARQRTINVETFQSNQVRVALAIDSAGGVGIDLDDQDGRYPRAALVNPCDNAVVFKQVLGRCARSSTKSPVLQRIICAEGTAEEYIYDSLSRKVHNISLINDADLDPLMPQLKKVSFGS